MPDTRDVFDTSRKCKLRETDYCGHVYQPRFQLDFVFCERKVSEGRGKEWGICRVNDLLCLRRTDLGNAEVVERELRKHVFSVPCLQMRIRINIILAI